MSTGSCVYHLHATRLLICHLFLHLCICPSVCPSSYHVHLSHTYIYPYLMIRCCIHQSYCCLLGGLVHIVTARGKHEAANPKKGEGRTNKVRTTYRTKHAEPLRMEAWRHLYKSHAYQASCERCPWLSEPSELTASVIGAVLFAVGVRSSRLCYCWRTMVT